MAREDYSQRAVSADAQSQAGNDVASVEGDIINIQDRLSDLENRPINLETDLYGLFETVSVAPTGTPSIAYDQIKIYVNSTTYRFYWYDSVGHVWHYVTATA